jgi:glycosyltransferase involved in cell wall biosynthesis
MGEEAPQKIGAGNTPDTRIALTVPRFEIGHAGGAEIHAKMLALKLKETGYHIEVLTTCARDHFTWKNWYQPGEYEVDGLVVRRFPANEERDVERFLDLQERITRFEELSFDQEKEWISEGIISEELFSYLNDHQDDYDVFVFIPYIFGTTYWGAQIVQKKAVLIPCLHDEPYARLKIFQELFDNVKGIIPSTQPEIQLAKRLFDVPDYKLAQVAMGFTPADDYVPARFREKHGLKRPFIYYTGRREGGKNTDLLIEMFRTYKQNNDDDLALVLAGSGEVLLQPGDKSEIIDLGFLDEQDKQDAYAACLAFCTPSVNESLSIVVMEAWLAGRPVIANAKCAVTKDHCIRSDGGLFFDNYYEFEEILNVLMENDGFAAKLGENGRTYVHLFYSWPRVISNFRGALGKFGLA